jgi:hypothetical protein
MEKLQALRKLVVKTSKAFILKYIVIRFSVLIFLFFNTLKPQIAFIKTPILVAILKEPKNIQQTKNEI